MAFLMIDCKKYSELVSKELDRPLSWWDKVSVKVHSLVCPACHHVKKQLETLRQACRFAPDDHERAPDNDIALPEDVCSHIKSLLKNTQSKSDT